MFVKAEEMAFQYRCRKQRDFAARVPAAEKEETEYEAIVDAIVSAEGNEENLRNVIFKQIEEKDFLRARNRLLGDILRKNMRQTYEQCVDAFYAYADAFSDETKKIRKEEDKKLLERYFRSETRERDAIKLEENVRMSPHVTSTARIDAVYTGPAELVTGAGKKKQKLRITGAEAVRLFPGSPTVTQRGKKKDGAVCSRLELVVMLKTLYESLKRENRLEGIEILMASYYFLRKTGDSSAFDEDFFSGLGGNVVRLTVKTAEAEEFFRRAEKDFEAFYEGEAEEPDEVCERCRYMIFCREKENQQPTEEKEFPKKKLPALSEEQEKAVHTLYGNIRCLATAGSGKTTVMAYRITELLKDGVRPEEIGCFTFTNLAAREMKDRISGFCAARGIHADISKMQISTVHSFGDRVIRDNYKRLGFTEPPTLINEIQKTRLLAETIKAAPVIEELEPFYKNPYTDYPAYKGILPLMKYAFQNIRENSLEDASWDQMKKTGMFGYEKRETYEQVADLYHTFTNSLKKNNLVTHDDQEDLVIQLAGEDRTVLWSYGLKHICVDEYQDTSPKQYKIFHLLRENPESKSLFAVGDEDQSIYRFRGADPTLIVNFHKMFSAGAHTDTPLSVNYRSSSEIVDFANRIVSKTPGRVDIHPAAAKGPNGKEVSVLGFDTKTEEQTYIVGEIETALKHGTAGEEDIAILTATNAELGAYAKMLDGKGIRYVNLNPAPVLENRHVQAAIAAASFLLGDDSALPVYALDKNALTDGDTMQKRLTQARARLLMVQTAKDFLNAIAPNAGEEDEVYQSFYDSVKGYGDTASLRDLLEYINDYSRFGENETVRREKSYPGVVLTTMHSSKGKEWPVVFCSVSKLHEKDMTAEDICEKRRLLFVACTRAEEELHVTGTGVAYGSKKNGFTPNMFLKECMEASAS